MSLKLCIIIFYNFFLIVIVDSFIYFLYTILNAKFDDL